MREIIDVKENYSLIVKNGGQNIENNRYQPVNEMVFNKIIQFIENFEKDDDNEDVLRFMYIKHLKGNEYGISLKNYVGTIQIDDGTQIQILPKISFEEDSGKNEEKTKKIMKKMLGTLKYFKYKEFNMSDTEIENIDLYEAFINMYIKELSKLIKIGIKSLYVNEIDNIGTIREKILMNEQITKNIVHKEKNYCKYDEYKLDIPENRIIKATLLKLLKLSKSNENIKEINKLLIYFDDVHQSKKYDIDFSRVKLDKTNKYYELIIEWSKVILKDKSFTNFSGINNTRALLFPMEKLFEAYVARMIYINIPKNYKVITQNIQKYLYNNPNRFGLKPDIIIKENGKIIAVLDTKWKNLNDKAQTNYGISRDDMYQMYVYAKKYNTNNIWLLYPLNNEMRNHDKIVFETDENIKVNIFFVDLDIEKIQSSVENLIDDILKK